MPADPTHVSWKPGDPWEQALDELDYIRSLARDLGNALGTGGYCRLIRRTAVGPFDLAESTPLDELPEELQQHHLLDASTG